MDLPMLLNHSFCILERIYSCILKDIGQVNTPLFLSWSEFSSLFDHSYQHAKCYWSFYIKKKKNLCWPYFTHELSPFHHFFTPLLSESLEKIVSMPCLQFPPLLLFSSSILDHTPIIRPPTATNSPPKLFSSRISVLASC